MSTNQPSCMPYYSSPRNFNCIYIQYLQCLSSGVAKVCLSLRVVLVVSSSRGMLVNICLLTNLHNRYTCNENLRSHAKLSCTFYTAVYKCTIEWNMNTQCMYTKQLTKAIPPKLGHQRPPRWPCDRRGELPPRDAPPHVHPSPPSLWLHLEHDALQPCGSRRRTTLHQKWVSFIVDIKLREKSYH